MPYYDVVKFKCPNCGEAITVEDNTGDEGMAGWGEGTVPIETAKRVIGRDVLCEQCFESFTVRPDPPEFLSLRLVKKR